MPRLTHSYLVDVAYQWLRDYRSCLLFTKEFGAGTMHEIPDAIGFKMNNSILVECKISRSDFKADEKKVVRRYDQWAMGQERWFLVPKGLVTANEIPADWGLLYCCPSRHQRGFYIREVVKATNRALGRQALRMERELLVSIAWRAASSLQLLMKQGFASSLVVEQMDGQLIEVGKTGGKIY
jgi:hypothetical protein